MRIDTKRSLVALVILGTAAIAGCGGSSSESSYANIGAPESDGRAPADGTSVGAPGTS